jgi:hypothetical protein
MRIDLDVSGSLLLRRRYCPNDDGGGAADSLLGNVQQIIELACVATLLHLKFHRILRTFNIAEASGVGAALRNHAAPLLR